MARPRLGDSASKRLQMVITEDELKSIEDWQFANRVPSKSEAIRRLCQMGLVAHQRSDDAAKRSRKILDEANRHEDMVISFFKAFIDDVALENIDPREIRKRYMIDVLDGALELYRLADAQDARLSWLQASISSLAEAETLEEGRLASRNAFYELEPLLENYGDHLAAMDNQRRYFEVLRSLRERAKTAPELKIMSDADFKLLVDREIEILRMTEEGGEENGGPNK